MRQHANGRLLAAIGLTRCRGDKSPDHSPAMWPHDGAAAELDTDGFDLRTKAAQEDAAAEGFAAIANPSPNIECD